MRYSYRALNPDGGQVSGTLEADSLRAAARSLQHQGLNVLNLRALSADTKRTASRKRVKSQDILLAMHQLCTLLESGVSLEQAVGSLADSFSEPWMAQQFSEMATALRRGEMFSQALRTTDFNLPAYFHPLSEAGELTGKLADALRDGVTQWETDMQVASEFRQALTYPAILIVSGVAAVLMIFTLVVPKFTSLLEKTQGDVPLLAQVVLGTGGFVNDHLLWVGLAAGGLAAVGLFVSSDPAVRQRARNGLVRVPVISDWLWESEIGRWSAMLSTLLENRVPLMDALELAQRYVKLGLLQARLTHVTRAVRRGVTLAEALRESQAITATGYNLVRVGEQAGELPKMLQSLARLYMESGRSRMKRVLVLVEPAAIIVIGAVVGLIMGGIILAIISVNNVTL